MILYKYLPAQYLSAFLDRGEVLFRNLCYFRKVEGDCERSDPFEGMHVDAPDHPVTLEVLSTGKKFQVDAADVRKVDFENIYVFCLSRSYSTTLMHKFGADACVKITNSDEFIARCKRSISRIVHLDRCGLIAGSVEYYDRTKAVAADITDPGAVAFLKAETFHAQEEFRLAFGVMNSLSQRQDQMHVILKHALDDELKKDIDECRPRKRSVRIGRIREFCEIVVAKNE